MKVEKAKYEDIAQMIEVCRLNLVGTNKENFSSNDFTKKGFLVTALTEESAKEMLDDEARFYVAVAKEDKEVVGYLSACDASSINDDFPEDVSEIFKRKTIYYKQIAKKPNAKNVGENLINSLISEAKNLGYEQIICRIVHQPFLNQKSISFHEKFGFQQISEITQNNALGETTLGVYLKKL
jgi:L-amino acid N-acyltransferase YncA